MKLSRFCFTIAILSIACGFAFGALMPTEVTASEAGPCDCFGRIWFQSEPIRCPNSPYGFWEETGANDDCNDCSPRFVGCGE